jgi:hypothetical protein
MALPGRKPLPRGMARRAWGACATSPVLRGLWATSPKRPRRGSCVPWRITPGTRPRLRPGKNSGDLQGSNTWPGLRHDQAAASPGKRHLTRTCGQGMAPSERWTGLAAGSPLAVFVLADAVFWLIDVRRDDCPGISG